MLSTGIRRRRAATIGVLAGLVAALVASPAFAHDELIGTDPGADSVVETLPDSVTLTFSGVLLTGDGATEVVVTDSAGTDLTASDAVVDGVRVSQPLAGTTAGTVQVAWRVVSSDGHPISGEFSFSVGSPSEPAPSSTAPGGTADAETEFPVWIVVGVIVVAVAGAVLVVSLLTRRRPSGED